MIFALLILFNLNISSAQNSQPQELYLSGVQAFQSQDFQKAQELFKQGLEMSPNNLNLLYNWGLAELKLENKGLAVAAWRKALSLSPGFTPAREALKFASDNIQGIQSAQVNYTGFDKFWNWALSVNYQAYLFLGLLLMIGWAALLLKYWGLRNSAFAEESPRKRKEGGE